MKVVISGSFRKHLQDHLYKDFNIIRSIDREEGER